jgi:pSer/pThr/pTyr-binding forkhead associated (FHA) protein
MIICPNPDCKAENEDGVLYCDKCGADLSKAQEQASPVQPQLDDEEENIVDATGMESAEYAPIVTPPARATPAQKAAVQPAIQATKAKLTVLRGEKIGEEFPIIFDGLYVIGRTDPDGRPVDIDLTDQEASLTQPSVSRQHAAITVENGKYMIEDLGSTNKVSINRKPFLQVGQPRELNDGDIIILGRIHLKFTLQTF